MGILTSTNRTSRVADALTELFRFVAHYPVDFRWSNVRLHCVPAEISDLDLARCTPDQYPALLKRLAELATADVLRTTAQDLGESEDWVRAYSMLRWQDKSQYIISGQLFVGYLYTDVGGFDPMPVV